MSDSENRKSWVVRFRGLPARFEVHEKKSGGAPRLVSPFGGFVADVEAERCLTACGVSPELAADVVANARRNGLATILGPERTINLAESAIEEAGPTH